MRAATVLALTGLVLGISSAVAGAAGGQPDRSPTPRQATSTRPSPDARCTLSPSLSHPGSEFASCLSVGARLSAVPAVGQTATLTVTVKAARSEPDTRVTIDLPPTLEFADGTSSTPAVSGAGQVARADVAAMALSAGASRSFTRMVRAVSAGFGEIAVSARSRRSAKRTDSGTDSVYLTTGASAATSFLGGGGAVYAARSHATVRLAGRSAGPERRSTGPARSAPIGSRPATQTEIAPNTPSGTSCVEGLLYFYDQTGASRPARSVRVDVIRGKFSVATTATGGYYSPNDSGFHACWGNGGATQFVRVRFTLRNDVWQVADLNNVPYTFSTRMVAVADGATFKFGTQYPADRSYDRALHAFQEADDLHEWIYDNSSGRSGCWSPFETTCHQLVIHWQPDSTTGTFWDTSGVYLLPGSPDTGDEPVHEYAHNLMYELYDLSYPGTTNCTGPRQFFVTTSASCAWVEGWADSVAVNVYDTMVWTVNGGATFSLDVTWNEGFGYDTGERVEGRVAQAIHSLAGGYKLPWDFWSGNAEDGTWFVLLHDQRPHTFAAMWAARATFGYHDYDSGQRALGALYQGTIDYGFRNSDFTGRGRHFPEAIPDHRYGQDATSTFWGLVAERPDAGTDTDLYLYDDFGLGTLLSGSGYGPGETDFVAINSNSGHRALQTYYPVVHQYSGSGGYTIQERLGGNSTLAQQGAGSVSLYDAEPVAIWDSYQAAGVPSYYRAVPTDSAQDLQLAVLPASADIVPRGASVQGADLGPGNPASATYTPTADGWGGLVLLNNGMTAGTVTVYADTSGPTRRTVSINGGAASTTSPHVTLTLSASDAQTGVDRMQISTDGVFDTEPVRRYATSATTQLPGTGTGTKRVYVRYSNNAGMWSTPVSDSIVLKAPPLVTSVTPGSATTAGGSTVTVRGKYFAGAAEVRFGTVPAISFTVVNTAKITAVTPAHAAGAVQVRVTTAEGTSAASTASRFTYVAAPALTQLTPDSGPAAGATLRISGTHLTGATAVIFGGVPASSYTVISGARITAVAPAHAAGAVRVRVTTAGGTSAPVLASRYTFE